MGTLFIVATPIGNMQDITLRALDTLKHVSIIYAEDTRVTAKLVQAHGIKTPMQSYHQHSSARKVSDIISLLEQGEDIAVVSDAGTPGINDPGGRLIHEVMQALPDASVVPIPGPNAAITALSVSGLPAERFVYLGFVPLKKGRQTFFRDVAKRVETQVLYESKHRIRKTLEQLKDTLGRSDQSDRTVVVARELTKKFETLYRGTAATIGEMIPDEEVLGEFVVIVGPSVQ